MKILDKNGLSYSIRVLFAPGVVIRDSKKSQVKGVPFIKR